MARGDWNTSGITNLKNRSAAKVGFEWRYANTEQKATAANADVIQVIPFIYRTSSSTTAYQNTVVTSYLKYSYGSYTSSNQNMGTAYNYEYCSSLNTRYYAERRSLANGHPLRSASGGTTITKSGNTYYGYEITIPHKDDGTQDPVTITWFFNGADSHGNATAKATITLDPVLRTPIVNVTNVHSTTSSITLYVESGNEMQLDGVRVLFTDAQGESHTFEYYETNISSITIPIEGSGTLDPDTSYTFTLYGYNAENDAWSSESTTYTAKTSPSAIRVRSINVIYENRYNPTTASQWTASILANLMFGNDNSLGDLAGIQYTLRNSNYSIIRIITQSRQYYAQSVQFSNLIPSTTYIIEATAYTYTGNGSDTISHSAILRFTTPAKPQKVWIKNSQGEWISGDLYIKTSSGWKLATAIYIKDSNGVWKQSTNN